MSNPTPRMALNRHVIGERFVLADYNANWDAIDRAPGAYICTSTTRPTTWTSAQTGRRIVETDTGLEWSWSGSAFTRTSPKGEIGYAARTTSFTTSSNVRQEVLSVNVDVPPGGRSVLVAVSAPEVFNTVGLTKLHLLRGALVLRSWNVVGKVGTLPSEVPGDVSVAVRDLPSAGVTAYSLACSVDTTHGGSSTVTGSQTQPVTITILEV